MKRLMRIDRHEPIGTEDEDERAALDGEAEEENLELHDIGRTPSSALASQSVVPHHGGGGGGGGAGNSIHTVSQEHLDVLTDGGNPSRPITPYGDDLKNSMQMGSNNGSVIIERRHSRHGSNAGIGGAGGGSNDNLSTPPRTRYRPPVFTIGERGEVSHQESRRSYGAVSLDSSVWHVIPVTHRRVMAIFLIGYAAVNFILAVAAISVASASDLKLCNEDIRKFLMGFGVLAFFLMFLIAVFLTAFYIKILPMLFTGKEFPEWGILLCAGMVLVCLINYAFSIYGLNSARSQDKYLQHRCGQPWKATNGVATTYLLVTTIVGIMYVAHYQWALGKLQERQRRLRASAAPPGDAGDNNVDRTE